MSSQDMKAVTTFWLLLLLTLGFTARSDSSNERQIVAVVPPASRTSRLLVVENAVLRAKLARIQDALDDASDKIETAQNLMRIEGEPAALEYATSQLSDAQDAIADAVDEADPEVDDAQLLDAAFKAIDRTNAKPSGKKSIAIEAGPRSAAIARRSRVDSNGSSEAANHQGQT